MWTDCSYSGRETNGHHDHFLWEMLRLDGIQSKYAIMQEMRGGSKCIHVGKVMQIK